MVDGFTHLSPRERNILFNKINLFVSIGSREYYQNITLANGLKSIRELLFNGFLFLVFMIALPWDGRRSWKTRVKIARAYAFEIFAKIKSENEIKKEIEKVKRKLEGEEVDDSRFEVVEFGGYKSKNIGKNH